MVTARRVIVVDDSVLFRQGLAGLLRAADIVVCEELDDAQSLNAAMHRHRPDAVVLDVRMPPTFTDEGIRAAQNIRADYPEVGVLVLSTYAEGSWAAELFAKGSAGLGYLLKDRVGDVQTLVAAIERVSSKHTVVDPDVIERLLTARTAGGSLSELSQREREVLSLMAEGLSNAGIGERLFLSGRTAEAHIAPLVNKLPLQPGDRAYNRRVLAVLAFLREATH
jgi:DNA-binding NarL/FixJ family response regulator